MRRITTLTLTVVAIVTGLLSMTSLFWWLNLVYGTIFLGYGQMLFDSLSPPGSHTGLLAYQAINYFVTFGGALGWVALFALCAFSGRRLNQMPKWVFAGFAVGVVAAAVVPGGGIFACFPIIFGGSLLFRCWLAAPNHSSKRTREKPRSA